MTSPVDRISPDSIPNPEPLETNVPTPAFKVLAATPLQVTLEMKIPFDRKISSTACCGVSVVSTSNWADAFKKNDVRRGSRSFFMAVKIVRFNIRELFG
jgi:hypothetical protein